MFLENVLELSADKLLEFGISVSHIQELDRADTGERFIEVVHKLDDHERNSLLNYVRRESPATVVEPLITEFDLPRDTTRGLYDELLELTEEQQSIVEYDDNLPLIVQGVPGSGKTTVAVQRLRNSAEESTDLAGNFLLLCFNRTLAQACEQLLRKSCGGRIPENTNVLTVHAWLKHLLESNGQNVDFVYRGARRNFIDDAAEEAFEQAPQNTEKALDELTKKGPAFWRREFDVIAGRCGSDLDEYLDYDRPERSKSWNEPTKRIAYEVYDSYRKQLTSKGLADFAILPDLCRDHVLSEGDVPNYEEIIVDEAQDLPSATIDFVIDVASRVQSRLVFLGDAGQSIYRHTFSWSEVASRVEDLRLEVLTRNLRTPGEIGAAAERITPDKESVEATYERFNGEKIQIIECAGEKEIKQTLVEQIQSLDETGVERNRIGVLAPSRKKARSAMDELRDNDIEVDFYTTDRGDALDLADRSVKVSTIQSSKGLEFDHVILLRAESMYFPGERDYAESVGVAYEHRRELRRRLLHVALTRCRESVTVICNEGYASHFFDDIDDSALSYQSA